jgi:hypothetical protein
LRHPQLIGLEPAHIWHAFNDGREREAALLAMLPSVQSTILCGGAFRPISPGHICKRCRRGEPAQRHQIWSTHRRAKIGLQQDFIKTEIDCTFLRLTEMKGILRLASFQFCSDVDAYRFQLHRRPMDGRFEQY